MRSKTDNSQKASVIRDWTDDAIVHPLKQVGSDMTVLLAFAGVGILVGTVAVVYYVKNKLIG
jgi:hypothetical protein